MSFSRKSHIVISAAKGGYNYQANLTTEYCLDDIGDPSLLLPQMIQENPEAFANAIVNFITDTHPDIAPVDITGVNVYGEEDVEYYRDPSI